MPPKRTRKLEIFADSGAPARSSPRNKRKQPDADNTTTTTEAGSHGPTPKRPALGAKTANSRDNSRRADAKAAKQEKAESFSLSLLGSQLTPSSPPHNTVPQKT